MLRCFDNSPLVNTLIIYLFVMYLIISNNTIINDEGYVILPLLIYSFFVYMKINN